MRLLLLLTTVGLIFFQCSHKSENASESSSNSTSTFSENTSETSDDEEPLNGIYCASVDYYYYKSRTTSHYTLNIEVEDGELTRIYWPNGGWLDGSHFSNVDISDGTAYFTSYEDVEYHVTIKGRQGECITSSDAIDEDELIRNFKRKRREEEEAQERENDEFYQQLNDEIERQEREEEEEEG